MYSSPHPPIDFPRVPLADFVLARAAGRGQRAALICAVTGRKIKYAELPDLVDRTAAGLAALGVAKGGVCAIFSPNSPDYAIAILAIARLGAVATTASPLYTQDELAKQLRDSQARVLFTSSALAPVWGEAIKGTSVERVVAFDSSGPGAAPGPTAAHDPAAPISFAALAATRSSPPPVGIEPDDLFALPYSSGTTGLPKGVMLTHANIVANMLQVDSARHYIDGEEATIAFLPFFHIYGLTIVVLLSLWAGVTVVVMPKFELEPYLDLVERHRATVLHVVPPIVVAFAKHPALAGRDLSFVRKLFSGAAPLGADVIEQATRRLGCVLQQGYGMTEASPATHVTTEDVARRKARIDRPAGGEHRMSRRRRRDGAGCRARHGRRNPGARPAGHAGLPRSPRRDARDRRRRRLAAHGRHRPRRRRRRFLHRRPAQGAHQVQRHAGAPGGARGGAAVASGRRRRGCGAVAGHRMRRDSAGLRRSQGRRDSRRADGVRRRRVSPHKKVRRVDFVDAIPKSPSGKILRRLLRDRPT